MLPSALHAQATAAATRGGIVQAGAAYTYSNEDEYTGKHLQGMTFYGTFDLNNHIGVEGNVHLVSVFKSYFDFNENSYDAGLRWALHYRKFTPYAKGLVGLGHATAPNPNQIVGGSTPGTYFLFGLGGGLDYGLYREDQPPRRLRISALAELPTSRSHTSSIHLRRSVPVPLIPNSLFQPNKQCPERPQGIFARPRGFRDLLRRVRRAPMEPLS